MAAPIRCYNRRGEMGFYLAFTFSQLFALWLLPAGIIALAVVAYVGGGER